MPAFKTVDQAQQWCSAHFPSTTETHWSLFNMDFMTFVKITLGVTFLASAYYIGKEGLPDTWAGIKNIYAWIRNFFSGAKTTTVSTSAVVPTTPVA